jgi:hypothetical protein
MYYLTPQSITGYHEVSQSLLNSLFYSHFFSSIYQFTSNSTVMLSNSSICRYGVNIKRRTFDKILNEYVEAPKLLQSV